MRNRRRPTRTTGSPATVHPDRATTPLTGDGDRRGATASIRQGVAGPSTRSVHPFPLALVYVHDERRGDIDEHPVRPPGGLAQDAATGGTRKRARRGVLRSARANDVLRGIGAVELLP